MKKSTDRLFAFTFGIVFVTILLALAIIRPDPTPFQYTVFRIILSLAAGGVAAMIPGFLTINISTWLRAGGALAVFVVVFFFNPAQLTGVEDSTKRQREIEKPIVSGESALMSSKLNLMMSTAHAQVRSDGPPDLSVENPDDLKRPGVLMKRYGRVIVATRARMPAGTTLIANDIQGRGEAALTGTNFSVVARSMSNIAVDASAEREPGSAAGSVWLYIKRVDNSRLWARGADGALGKNGAPGVDGANGPDGRSGRCDGFGRYRGADSGGNGGNGGDGAPGSPGGDGTAGGAITLTTIVEPINSAVDVMGGQPGRGGAGGPPGAAGRGGKGGAGCVGLGGSQPTRANGNNGQPGNRGPDGPPGVKGAAGEYRLILVNTFDDIVVRLSELSNDRVHDALRLNRSR